jgi:hypothetical protein
VVINLGEKIRLANKNNPDTRHSVPDPNNDYVKVYANWDCIRVNLLYFSNLTKAALYMKKILFQFAVFRTVFTFKPVFTIVVFFFFLFEQNATNVRDNVFFIN